VSNNELVVSIYGMLSRKKLIKHSLCLLLCCLLYSPIDVILRILQLVYLDPIFHCTSFQFGKCPRGTFHNVHRRRLPYFQKKKLIKHSLRILLCCLLYSPIDVIVRILQLVYLDPIFHCTSFQFGKCPRGTFHNVHRRRLPCFQRK
jgi:multisubunit Na+/H+ antiporter MnhE subunit